jgi:hypothetical protein
MPVRDRPVPRRMRAISYHPTDGGCWAESRLELREELHRRAVHDLAVRHFAIRDMANAQIRSYIPHDEPPLGPQPFGNLCL